jgi:hypothetical protein
MSDSPSKRIPPSALGSEAGARELAISPDMKPYLPLMMAELHEQNLAPHIAAISRLPLVKRYVWRVASALKWAFADLETTYVEVDCQTLSPEDQNRLVESLKDRPLQFCLFMSALIGEEQMEQLMISAVREAREAAGEAPG